MTAQQNHSIEAVPFHLHDGYLMIVQAAINGSGPFRFLLDTGTTRTVIDPALAQQLHSTTVGKVSLTGILHQRQDKLVELDELRLGNASASGLDAVVDSLTRQKTLAPGIRGVIGEDFLSKFDILIDYQQHWLRFGEDAPAGERCRFKSTGQYRGMPTSNRLLLAVEFVEVSGEQLQLQLDTGARVLELFPVSPDSVSRPHWGGSMATSSGTNGTLVHSNVTIKIGSTMVPGQDVVQSRRAMAFDAAGLLPASIFQRIYISHSGSFVIFDPDE